MSIGVNLRRLRKVKGLTLAELARASGVSVALLSQIERSKADPSVNTLRKLAGCLDVSVAYFFGDAENDTFVTRESARRVLRMGAGVTYYLLSRKTAPSLEVLYNVFDAGATTGQELYSHPGEECGFLIEGTLQVQLGDAVFILEAGDTISYSSSIPHKLTNIGTVRAKAIWVNTPPTF